MSILTVPGITLGGTQFWDVDGTAVTLDATGESATAVGFVQLPAGTGSKTLSSAGGEIWWKTATVTAFANGGTRLDIGIQDVLSTGLNDGTYDVSATLIGGTDTINANVFNKAVMETGTKTMAHGDLIAVHFSMVSRAGADSFQVDRLTRLIQALNAGCPYGIQNVGGVQSKVNLIAPVLLKFDDGTFGWLQGMSVPSLANTAQSFSDATSPDEYGAVFTPPVSMRVDGIGTAIGLVISTDTFELILYRDPLGTPAVIQTLTVPPEQLSGTAASLNILRPITPVILEAGVDYMVALRPTSSGAISTYYQDLGSGFDDWKRSSFFGTSLRFAGRTDQTGAFSVVQSYYLPVLFLNVSAIGSASSLTFIG